MRRRTHGIVNPPAVRFVASVLLFITLVSASSTSPVAWADDTAKSTTPHPKAVTNSHATGDVDLPELVPYIVKDKNTLQGIVLDETDAVLKGSWQYSTHTPPYVGIGYLHDRKQGKGVSSVTFTPDLPKTQMYEVRMSHCYNVRRSTNTPITIHCADGDTTLRINQQHVPKHNRLFRSLGTFRFNKGREGYVRIRTNGTDGKYVIADAVQFIPRSPAVKATLLSTCDGFLLPETVVHDPKQDLYFVSCMVGNPTALDNNGEIRIIDPANPKVSRPFIKGGMGDITLHGPKGMAVDGNTLWVADIDSLRAFDTSSGQQTSVIDLKQHGAIAINDIAIDSEHTIYVSDPRLVFDHQGGSTHVGVDRIFAVSTKGDVRTVVLSPKLFQPNGLAWDNEKQRLLVAPIQSKDILAIDPNHGAITIAATSKGRFDGIEILPDGQIIVSCLEEGTVRNVSQPEIKPLVSGRKFPGNIGIDRKRNRLLVPLIAAGRIEIWQLSF